MLVRTVRTIVKATATYSVVMTSPQKRSGRSIAYSRYAPASTLKSSMNMTHLHPLTEIDERPKGSEGDEPEHDHSEKQHVRASLRVCFGLENRGAATRDACGFSTPGKEATGSDIKMVSKGTAETSFSTPWPAGR
jgi:hypothetical protein